jgi:hypothetical protein
MEPQYYTTTVLFYHNSTNTRKYLQMKHLKTVSRNIYEVIFKHYSALTLLLDYQNRSSLKLVFIEYLFHDIVKFLAIIFLSLCERRKKQHRLCVQSMRLGVLARHFSRGKSRKPKVTSSRSQKRLNAHGIYV